MRVSLLLQIKILEQRSAAELLTGTSGYVTVDSAVSRHLPFKIGESLASHTPQPAQLLNETPIKPSLRSREQRFLVHSAGSGDTIVRYC